MSEGMHLPARSGQPAPHLAAEQAAGAAAVSISGGSITGGNGITALPGGIGGAGVAASGDTVVAISGGSVTGGNGRQSGDGVAAAGAAGVVRVLELLEDEVRICMGLLGVDRLGKLDRSYLHPGAPPVNPAHVHSALPLIGEGY